MADGAIRPSYFAIIPAFVRYDADLRPNAKLLYAEITALADATGYCWASNDYFAGLFGLSGKTISDLIHTLSDKKYVRVEVLRDQKTNAVTERRIWIANRGVGLRNPPPKNGDTPPPKNKGTPPPKNGEENNYKKLNNTPYNPPEGDAQADTEEQFSRFWAAYPIHKDRKRAERYFRRLKVTEDKLRAMLTALERQKQTQQWRDGAIPYPSTWLNGARWEDELTTGDAVRLTKSAKEVYPLWT